MTKKQILKLIEAAYRQGIDDVGKSDLALKEVVSLRSSVVAERIYDAADKKKKAEPKTDPCHQPCVEFWLKEFHEGWTFTGMHGRALKSILTKIRTTLREKCTDEVLVVNSFKAFCRKLPAHYTTKDLPYLDSKYNEIVTEIQVGKKKDNFHSQNSAQRAFGDYGNR